MANGSNPSARPISYLNVPSEDEWPVAVRELVQSYRTRLGFVPNIMPAFALLPEHFMGWWAYFDDLMRGDSESGLPKAQREMIAVVVSAETRCHY